MAVTAHWYGNALRRLASGQVNWETDVVRVALLTAAYSPDQDAHDTFADVSAFETSGTGYTAGGEAIANKTLLPYDAPTNRQGLDGDDVTWANSTITARYAVVYIDDGSTNPLLGYIDFGEDVSSTNASFTIQWDANGIFTLTAD